MKFTEQMNAWAGAFGKEYTDRNATTVDDMESLWMKNFGVTRTAMNRRFLDSLDRGIHILEVGCNIGNQLLCLERMGFRNLFGIEIQRYAALQAAARTGKGKIVQASAFQLPFRDGSFELVFTSGVLIHVHPSNLKDVLREIHRCTRRYIWGTEYFSDECTEVEYRGHGGLLWKDDFAARYAALFDDLELVREERLNYLQSSNVDSVFLLKKKETSTSPS